MPYITLTLIWRIFTKKLILSGIIAGIFSTCHAVTNSCQEQRDDINRKLATAKTGGDSYAERRPETALTKVNTWCTEGQQSNKAGNEVVKKERKVKKAELEPEQAQDDLAEAQQDGRAAKISDKTRKIEEKTLKLESVKQELEEAKSDYQRLN